MIKFDEIYNTATVDDLQKYVTVNARRVWDYKSINTTVYLISSDQYIWDESEYVTLGELARYIYTCGLSLDEVDFKDEETGEMLNTANWFQETLAIT